MFKMPVEKSLNKTLKKMWKLNEKIVSKKVLKKNEKEFYNKNLKIIKKYYLENNLYWKNKKSILRN